MASFEIVEFVDGKPRSFPAGVFPDGQSAASIIASLQLKYPNKKFQPRPLKDETRNWRQREQQRFDEGLYQPLGLDLKPIDGHFVHKAINVPENVAYTPNVSYGQQDKQVSTSINKYLLQFYPKMSITERRGHVFKYTGVELKDGLIITQNADEIEQVYIDGPSSCMAGGPRDFSSPYHPVRVYGGPDLGLAYYKDGESITARGVVWPEKKLYYSIYGDSWVLESALTNEGYRQGRYNTDWYGARLSSTDEGDYYVCPYIDFADYVKWDGTYLVVSRDGIGCGSTTGYTDNYRNDYDDDYDDD